MKIQPNLTSAEQQSLQAFIAFLQRQIPEQPKTIALFGSKSRGDSRDDSDIDVLIILKSDDRHLRREILREAARISLDYDVLLSPRVIGEKRWRKMRDFSFYQNVQQEAHKLALVNNQLIEQSD